MRRSVETTGIQIKPQEYITFVTRAAPLIRPLTITQVFIVYSFIDKLYSYCTCTILKYTFRNM